MKKTIVMPLLLLAVFTLICFNIDSSDGIMVHTPEDKTYEWQGADYITTVEVELTDTVLSKTGDRAYWFDTSIIDYLVVDEYTVTLNFDVTPNTLTNLLDSPSLNSTKLTTFNDDYSFMGSSLTQDNLDTVLGDLDNIPIIIKSGDVRLSKEEPITVDKTYQATVTLENAYAGTKQARFKLGRNSFDWTVTTQQNWEDNTLSHDNTEIVDGRLRLSYGQSDWDEEDFSYRFPITITGARPDNYPIRIYIDKTDNLNDKCNDNFADLRFYDNAGGDRVYHWIENALDGDYAIIWVQVLDNEDNEVILYVGNTGAENTSSAENVWGFDAGFDTKTGWTEVDEKGHIAFSIDNGIGTRLDFCGVDDDETSYVYATRAAGLDNFTMEWVWHLDNFDPGDGGYKYTGVGDGIGVYNHDDGKNAAQDDGAWVKRGIFGGTGTEYAASEKNDSYSEVGSANTALFYNTHYCRLTMNSTGVIYEIWENNENRSGAATDTNTNTVKPSDEDNIKYVYAFSASDYATVSRWAYGWIDSVTYREYVATEPTVSIGAEEEAVTAFSTDGIWFSTHWELGVYSSIENFIIKGTSDLRGEWDLSANLDTAFGMTYISAGTSDWYILDPADNWMEAYDNDADWSYDGHTGQFENTKEVATGFTYATAGGGMFLLCDSSAYEIDNYDTSTVYVDSFDVSGELGVMWDIEYMENDDTYYVGGGLNIFVYNSLGVYTGISHTLDLSEAPTGFQHDGEYWYVVMGGTDDVIIQYDNDFNSMGYIRSVGADEAVVRDVYSDLTNIYVIGTATDTAYMYSLDNTLDNIYAMILVDIDNDNVMDENTGWHLMNENGYWEPDNENSGYNYQVGFRFESSDNTFSPRIGSFAFTVDYHREWISVENWSDNLTVVEYEWVSAENWHNDFRVVGEAGAEPLVDLDSLMVNFIIPLMIVFAPAFAFAKKMGEVGFMAGLLVGVMISYVAFGFGLGIAIFLITLVAIMYMKGS